MPAVAFYAMHRAAIHIGFSSGSRNSNAFSEFKGFLAEFGHVLLARLAVG